MIAFSQQSKFRSQAGIEAITVGHSKWSVNNLAKMHITIPSSRASFVSQEMAGNFGDTSPGDAIATLSNLLSKETDGKKMEGSKMKPMTLSDYVAMDAISALSSRVGSDDAWDAVLCEVAAKAGLLSHSSP